MRPRLHWLFVAAVVSCTVQACAREHIVQTQTSITILTKEKNGGGRSASDSARLTSDARILEPVVRVASRLVAAARRSEYGPRARALCWVIAVYDNRTLGQSFVGPNGGIVVYTGTFRLAETEAGLAAVLSHELAHALTIDNPPFCAAALEQPPPLATREEELQTDGKGLVLLADAGYDPRELLRLWGRMKQQENNVGDEVLTHVTYDRRMEQIAQQLPYALMRYERAHRAPQKALPLN